MIGPEQGRLLAGKPRQEKSEMNVPAGCDADLADDTPRRQRDCTEQILFVAVQPSIAQMPGGEGWEIVMRIRGSHLDGAPV